MDDKDIKTLRSIAKRLADAIYYGTVKSIGTDSSVSPGLRHDDYDFLRNLANKLEIAKLEERLEVLKK